MSRGGGVKLQCCACSKPLNPQGCTCGRCAIGSGTYLLQRARELKEKSLRLQESLRELLHQQTVKEEQQRKLAALRQEAWEARRATQRAEEKLQALSTSFQPAEFNSSFRLARSTASSAIRQLATAFEGKWDEELRREMQLQSAVQAASTMQQEWQRKALTDIVVILGIVKETLAQEIPLAQHATPTDLYSVCSASPQLSKYFSDAFGQMVMFLGMAGAILHLPISHRWQFRGSRTRVWMPATFWDASPPASFSANAIVFTPGSESLGPDTLQALDILENSAAVAIAAQPAFRPSFSLLQSPIDWVVDFCCAASQFVGSSICIMRDGHAVLSQAALGTADLLAHDGVDEDDGWEFMPAANGLPHSPAPSPRVTAPSFPLMVERIKTIARQYSGKYQ